MDRRALPVLAAAAVWLLAAAGSAAAATVQVETLQRVSESGKGPPIARGPERAGDAAGRGDSNDDPGTRVPRPQRRPRMSGTSEAGGVGRGTAAAGAGGTGADSGAG